MMRRTIGTLTTTVLLGLIRAYRLFLAVLSPGACRFEPSCSEYALQALSRFGALAGGWLAVRRVLRCHPWGGSGYDPVPHRPGTACRPRPAISGGRVGSRLNRRVP